MTSKRQKILLAALDVFDKKGFHDAKISEIAKVAGIGKGTVYEYFDSKGSLFEEMLSYIIDLFMENIDEQVNQAKNPIEKLRALVEIEWQAATEYVHIMQLMITRIDSFSIEMKQKFMLIRSKSFDQVADIIKLGIEEGVFKDVDVEMYSLMFRGAFREAQMNYNINCQLGKSDHSDKVKNQLFDLFIEGLKS